MTDPGTRIHYEFAGFRLDTQQRLLLSGAEPITPVRLAGLVLGFAGVAVLVGLDVAGDGQGPQVRVAGPGVTALVRELRQAGDQAEPAWQASGGPLPIDAEEIPWLGVGL